MNELIKQKEIDYYTHYYRDDCCIPNWERQVEHRMNKPANELKRIKKLQEILNLGFTEQKHCLVGAGTGELAVVLKEKYNCEVYGVEPNEQALDIIHLKCDELGIARDNFRMATAEQTSFADNQFDFVHCVTVLEHVQDIEQSIDEMMRIVKPGGRIHIDTPNYAYPREGHYKILFPTLLPRWLGYLYLLGLGKSTNFLRTVNFITERDIDRILVQKQGIAWQRIYEPLEPNQGRLRWLLNYLRFKRFVYPNQEIIITKLNRDE